ncbi:DUF4956 domain-containing protein [Alphaproteobacteria bacterium]|nr:DUF4956 domain-containing protein [Alphaproteobacteria bacterium]
MDLIANTSSLDVVPVYHFPLMIIIAIALTSILRWIYIKFSTQISEKRHFSLNFIYLSLIVLLIISVIKSSLALSLGLVGALSIVRFRTAIKNPEELIFLFMSIAVGVGLGAGKIFLVVVATIVFAMTYAFLSTRNKLFRSPVFLISVHSKSTFDLNRLFTIQKKHLPNSEIQFIEIENGGGAKSWVQRSVGT